MLNKIVIITPAIPRKNIHTESFKTLHSSLEGYKEKNFKIVHIINIDCPKKILDLGYNLEETIDNFNRIIPEDIEKVYLHGFEPNFSNAYKRIWLEAEKYMNDRSVILFFEDDWKIVNDFNYIKILSLIDNNFLLTSHHFINNAPHVMSNKLYNLYNKYLKSTNISKIDPDYIRGNFYKYFLRKKKILCNLKRVFLKEDEIKKKEYYYKKTFKRKRIKKIEDLKFFRFNMRYYDLLLKEDELKVLNESNVNNCEIEKYDIEFDLLTPVRNISYDIGRKWRDNINLKKWDKDNNKFKTY